MELKILSSLELEDILKTPRSMIQCEDAAKVQAQHILQQVVKWGELPCLHPKMVDAIMRRECPKCWQELKEVCSGL